MTHRISSASLLLLLSLTACGQSVALPQGPESRPVATDTTTACTSLYASYAGWVKGCTGADLDDGEIDHLVTSCTERAALPGVDAPAAAIAGCGAQIAASSCAALPVDCITPSYLGENRPRIAAFLTNEDEVAYHLFPLAQGKLAAGLACDIAAQCQSGACSTAFSYTYDITCGICVDWKDVGEACDATTLCAHGSSCTDGVCKSWEGALGEACEAPKGSSNCQPDLYCPGSTCVPRLHVGDACGDTFDQWEACPQGSLCRDAVCQLIVEGHAGDACDDDVVRCEAEMLCADGHCRAPVANVGIGGACDGDVCAPSLRCRSGVCAVPATAGESCSEDRECAAGLICPSLLIQSPRCGAPRTEGQTCESSDACQEGLFCDGAIPMMPVCHPKAAAGEPCSDTARCWAPLSCIDGVCSELGVCSAP
jgi:hypothetical protein